MCMAYDGKGPQTHRIRSTQGHAAILVDPEAMGWTPLCKDSAKFLFHGSSHSCWRSIRDFGIIPGGVGSAVGRRSEAYYSAKWRTFGGTHTPLDEYPFSDEILVVIDLPLAVSKGCQF